MKAGVIEKVKFSDRAAPIVHVMKSDSSVPFAEIISERERANLVVQLAAIFLYIYTRRAAQSSQATKKCHASETAEARERRSTRDCVLRSKKSLDYSTEHFIMMRL